MKILLCAYSFPPISGPQSLRWLKLIKYISKRWDVDVLTINPAKGYGRYSADLLKEVPSNVRIFRTYPGIIHHIVYSRYKNSSTVRYQKLKNSREERILRKIYRAVSHISIPDRMVEWLPFALREGKKLLNENKYRLIISSAFPFSSHIVAFFLKRWSSLPWIADYGDPWALCSPSLLDRKIEEILVRSMDRIIVTTEETRRGYLSCYSLSENKVIVIPQGFEEELYNRVKPITSDNFMMVFTGNLSYSARGPERFFDALTMIKEKDFKMVITGYPSPNVVGYIKKIGINEKVEFTGFISQEEVIALQKGASVLVSFGWKGGYQIPGKIFEYMAARRPILHITYDEKDVAAKIIKNYNKGIVVENDPISIYKGIEKLYSLWKQNEYEGTFDLSLDDFLDDFSWKKLGERLERVIEDVLA